MKLIFASGNSHKIEEVNKLVHKYPLEIVGLNEIGYHEEIAETGSTLEENALIKARHIAQRYAGPVFSEDTGLEVDALAGAPGVYTARYAGKEKDPVANMDLLLHNLINLEDRRAQFRAVIALIANEKEHLFEGIIRGRIALEKSGTQGFGYDPIFIPEGHDRCFADLDQQIKLDLSHRSKAVLKMVSFIQSDQKI